MVLEDMDLMDRGLPPMRCKRAERETVSRMRFQPVTVGDPFSPVDFGRFVHPAD